VSRGIAILLAATAGALGTVAGASLLRDVPALLTERCGIWVDRLRHTIYEVVAPLRQAGSTGVDPTRGQRRRLQAAFALAALPIGWATADPLAALLLVGIAAALASKAIRLRRERYVRRLGEGAAPAARAIADALSSGHSARSALTTAAGMLDGAIGVELRRVSADLSLGSPTDVALERLRLSAACRRVDLIVAAIRLQRRSGGNLAVLLRDIADTIEDQSRLEDEAHAASSQARFTSTIVLAMPLFVLALGQLADPGMSARVVASPLGVWLLGIALVLWLAGATLVRRLGRLPA
jgi:tight adherence protein B